MNKTAVQFIRFSLIGVINTALDFFIYYSLSRWLGVDFLVANALAFIVSVSSSYYLNRRFTFRVAQPADWRQYVKFILLNTVTLLVVEVIMYIGVEQLSIPDLLVKLLATAVSVVLNFGFSKWVVFEYKK